MYTQAIAGNQIFNGSLATLPHSLAKETSAKGGREMGRNLERFLEGIVIEVRERSKDCVIRS